MAVAAWGMVIKIRNKHASDDEMAGWLLRRRRSGQPRRSSAD